MLEHSPKILAREEKATITKSHHQQQRGFVMANGAFV